LKTGTNPYGTLDSNRFTLINFTRVNDRSLYILGRRMVVVEGGNVLHHVKREGNCRWETVQGHMSRGMLLFRITINNT